MGEEKRNGADFWKWTTGLLAAAILGGWANDLRWGWFILPDLRTATAATSDLAKVHQADVQMIRERLLRLESEITALEKRLGQQPRPASGGR